MGDNFPFLPCPTCNAEHMIDCSCEGDFSLLEASKKVVQAWYDNFYIISPREIKALEDAIRRATK